MPAPSETICVDIGNSGLRCVRVPSVTPTPEAHRTTGRGESDLGSVSLRKLWLGEVLRIDWSSTSAGELSDSFASKLQPWLDRCEPSTSSAFSDSQCGPHKRRWLVSSVQRSTEAQLRNCVARVCADDYHCVHHSELGMEVAVDYPERVGVDRLLAARAALADTAARPLIVVQAGSAITVDWVEGPSKFCGGAILPGVPMMLRLLGQAADLLPELDAAELLNLPDLPGKNTTAAMTVGTSSAVVGGVQHLIARYRDRFGPDIHVVVSGGDGPRLAPHITAPVTIIDHLVLRGLAQFALEK